MAQREKGDEDGHKNNYMNQPHLKRTELFVLSPTKV